MSDTRDPRSTGLSAHQRELLGQLFGLRPPLAPDAPPPPVFEVFAPPDGPTSPLLVLVPHSGTRIPPEVRPSLVVDDDALDAELLAMTDHYTDRLFSAAPALGGVLVVNHLSRLVVDPERFVDDTQEPMAAHGLGAVYTRTSGGAVLRSPDFDDRARAEVLARYLRPYADAVERCVEHLLRRFGVALIVDGHSFPRTPLPWENPSLRRPDICLGHEPFHEHPFRHQAEEVFREHGLTVAHNSPFAGSYVPLRFYRKDPRVRSLMIEVRRDLYMDEETGEANADFERIRAVLREALDGLTP